ncbi:hypothetical protein ACWDTP_36010 [Mycobacterium sp. NPDC003449]
MTSWIDLTAVGKIVLFGVLVGAALPALFALAVRLHAVANGPGPVTGPARRRVLVVISGALVTFVVLAAIVGVLFIARDFIGHHTGWYLLGAVPK